jgi:hypothetical protein
VAGHRLDRLGGPANVGLVVPERFRDGFADGLEPRQMDHGIDVVSAERLVEDIGVQDRAGDHLEAGVGCPDELGDPPERLRECCSRSRPRRRPPNRPAAAPP